MLDTSKRCYRFDMIQLLPQFSWLMNPFHLWGEFDQGKHHSSSEVNYGLRANIVEYIQGLGKDVQA